MLDRFAVTSEQKVSTDQLKQDIALNRAMDAVLDRYGVNKVNKKDSIILYNNEYTNETQICNGLRWLEHQIQT